MTVPDWQTFGAGTRVRVALWLHSVVGAGGTFTKADLRAAFPGVEQIDRRMRDLRSEGWVINTYQEDRSLAPDELRLVAEGGRVWERGYTSRQPTAITAKERQATLRADSYACVLCGIGAGEVFPDDSLRTAKLAVVRRNPTEGAGRSLATLCDLCLTGGLGDTTELLLADIEALAPEQRRRLAEWVQRGARPRSKEDELWSRYRRLGRDNQTLIERHLR